MKNITKRISMALGIALLTSVTIMANTKYILMVNNKKIDTKIIVENGVTYVPLRLVGEALDAKVKFENGVISVQGNVVVQEDVGTMIYNNKEYPLPKNTTEEDNDRQYENNRVLKNEELQLIEDVKNILFLDIVIEGDGAYQIENGKKVKYGDMEFWREWVKTRINDNKVKEDFMKRFGDK